MNNDKDKLTIFVFGSNLAGVHGLGAARTAKKFFGAVYGQGEGLQGHSYAIPTKDRDLLPLSKESILEAVERFLEHAREHPEYNYEVTDIGCGYAGYTPEEIAPMFKNRPKNVNISENFKKVLDKVL